MHVTRVFARVTLQPPIRRQLERGRVQVFLDSANLSLHVSLAAQDSDGRRIETSVPDFGMSGPRRGIWHRWHGPPLPDDREQAERLVLSEHRVDRNDIEDGVNQMLGRDPTLHRPPRLAWSNLIEALRGAGLAVTEQELIDAPMTIELSDEAAAELGELRERRT